MASEPATPPAVKGEPITFDPSLDLSVIEELVQKLRLLHPLHHVLAIRSDPYPPHLDLNSLLSLPFFFNLAEYGLFFEFHGRIELSDSLFDLVFQNEATLADGRSYLFVVFRQGSFGKGNPAVEFEHRVSYVEGHIQRRASPLALTEFLAMGDFDPPLKPGCTELKLADATRLSVLPPSLNSITRPPQETPPASNGDLAVFKKRSVEPASPQTLMAVENLLVRLEKRYPKQHVLAFRIDHCPNLPADLDSFAGKPFKPGGYLIHWFFEGSEPYIADDKVQLEDRMLIFEDGSCFAVRVFKIGEFAQYGSSPADEDWRCINGPYVSGCNGVLVFADKSVPRWVIDYFARPAEFCQTSALSGMLSRKCLVDERIRLAIKGPETVSLLASARSWAKSSWEGWSGVRLV